MEQTGISLGDAMNLCNRGDYYGNAMWNNPMWALAFMRFMGGGYGYGWDNGFGGYGRNGAEIERAKADIIQNTQAINDAQTLSQQIRGITNGLSSLGFALNNTIKDGNAGVAKTVTDVGAGVAKAVADVGAGMAMGFCNTNHNIDNLKYENAKNTAEIINNAHADTQRILDKLCVSENVELRQQLADAKLANSQLAQNAYLVDQMKKNAGGFNNNFNNNCC